MIPPKIQKLFQHFGAIKEKHIDYAPVFLAMMLHYFPIDDNFTSYPCKKIINKQGHPTKPWFLTLQRYRDPVLVWDIRCPDDISNPALRARADEELRTILSQFTQEKTDASKISAISSFGTKFCFYEYDIQTKTITTEAQKKRLPASWWAHDFGTPQGVKAFEAFVAQVTCIAHDIPAKEIPRQQVPNEHEVAKKREAKKREATKKRAVAKKRQEVKKQESLKKQLGNKRGVTTRSRLAK